MIQRSHKTSHWPVGLVLTPPDKKQEEDSGCLAKKNAPECLETVIVLYTSDRGTRVAEMELELLNPRLTRE